MATAGQKVRGRPAHLQGSTHCAYTPDGKKLVTVGSNNTIRLYKTGYDGEPINIDDCQEQNLSVVANNEFFIVGSEDGTVSLYSLETHTFERFLTRCNLPVRDVALSPDGKLCAVASDELTVKVVGTEDTSKLFILKEHNRPTKHVAFDPRGSLLALSCTDGVLYIYSMTAPERPELIRKVDGVIGAVETDSESSSVVAWHPDGRAFAAPTPIRDIQVVSKDDWANQRSFRNGHEGDITAIAWSPNGAMLATAAKDKKILVWQTKDQSIIARYEYADVMDLAWHPTNNLLSFTTTSGEVYICPDFISDQFAILLKMPKQPAPFIHDPLSEVSANVRRPLANGLKPRPPAARTELTDDLDSLLDDGFGEEDDGFVVDDDGAGYTLGQKRPADDDDLFGDHPNKRANLLRPQYHEAFQPGSTPWRGNRKYLCLNLIGFVWTVDQDSHNTVTVEFYDHEFHRDFHFTDTFNYDKACLNENGTLFACPPTQDDKEDTPASIFYRPHETWTQRSDWRTELPKGEAVLAMSLGESFITVTTSADYVRVYTLFGLPYRVYRPKITPMVSCASWRDYVLTVGNGPCGADGRTKLLYSIENVKRDEICQNADLVALPEGVTIKSVFFSDNGDPCIYDSTGTLLTLLHWRQPSRASWVPLLDTKLLPRLASGRRQESYYPVAVADNKFHCIILKGGDQYPYFPRPLLSEFEFSIPLHSATPKPQHKTTDDAAAEDSDGDMDVDDSGNSESRKLEQQFMLRGIQAAQMADLVEATTSTHAQRSALARLEVEIDKTLLQLLAGECREGEERGMRALEMVELMRDRTGRMIEAAGKVAERYGRTILGEKIREVGERRVNGMDDFE
ncbi:WD40 repeat-like protein [Cryphonectria parasitica EP155]|uniref:WD40 repeat-like protein n=1 Tax=Cryphonectria parasitica (strain ATCC 38755 / EP155) TaxID=660469 RepID=A0A9P5CQD2_CRYP1|nr:WD40 repeat-like protein [Cryphonectria parasitica EP155]KAF3766322.1 WD40 repeat-like protein [Cryphonectria parasitica EP155]